jgi:Carboxypeptidase regulatory-like domain/TonB dependent receptor
LKRLIVFFLLILEVCFSASSLAQSTNATISGLVIDPSSKAVTEADVIILNEATGVRYPTTTNRDGIFTVSILPPGQYRVQVSKGGFKTVIKPDIILNVQTALELNFTLPLGAASESVTVEASSSLLNATDASVSTVIDQKFVQNIPLNGRSFQDLISMTPGVVTQNPQAQSALSVNGDFSVNGQRSESNNYTVDGVSGNIGAGNGYGGPQAGSSGSISASTSLGTTQSLVSVDALQEFRVLSSTYSAEFGRSPGGQFSFATKSGTNSFHGTVSNYLRNNFFDANDWFNDHYGKAQPALQQNDFSGTIGGPLLIHHIYDGRNSTFFFGSYEGLRLTQPQAATIQYVPDNFMRQQAPTALQPILNLFPEPNGMDYGTAESPGLAQFIESYSLPSSVDSASVRVDQIFTPKHSVFFRFADTPSSANSRTLSALSRSSMNTQTYTLGTTSVFSDHLNNEFRMGYARNDAKLRGSLDAFGGATPINMANALGIGDSSRPYPIIELYFPSIGNSTISVPDSGNQLGQWNITDTIILSFAKHEVKMGIDYRKIKSSLLPADTESEGVFQSAQSVLSNSADLAVVLHVLGSTPVFNETGAFIQDEWHLNQRLNASLGLRWDINPPPGEAHGNNAYTLRGNFADPASLTVAPRGTSLWKTDWYSFAPRLGLAWTALNKTGYETVVRAGGGLFFDTDNESAALGFEGLGFTAMKYLSGTSFPLKSTQLDFSPSITPPYTSSTIYAFPSHLQLPYTLQWNLSIQQALGGQQAFTMSYLGAAGRRLMATQQLSLSGINPDFGTVLYFPNNATSNYQALQLEFQRTLKKGLQVLASYTWAHSLDEGSNDLSLPVTRGNSDFDVRSNFVGALSWDVPSPRICLKMTTLLNRWSIDGRLALRTAFPITIFGNFLTDTATGNQYYGNANLNSNEPIYLYGDQYPGGRALNPAAFSLPSDGGNGNAPRNFVRGFGEAQANLALRKEFTLYENLNLQFRAEAFNIFNHPNFGYVDPYLTDATFGQATQMLNSSLGTMAAQYQQGGPRSMQFALKLSF